MPDDKNVIDEYEKEQEDFDKSVEEIFAEDAKSDEEILKAKEEEEAKKKEEANAASGDATKDSSTTSDGDDTTKKPEDADMFTTGQGDGDDSTPATDGDNVPSNTELQEKVKSLESELQNEKHKTASWNGRITAANDKVKLLEAKIEELEAAKVASDPDRVAQKQSDDEVLEKFRVDFPELGEVVDVLQRRVDASKGKALPDPDPPEPDKSTVAPQAEVDPATGKTEHMTAIMEIHPDLDEMVNSGVLKTWINKQKPFIQSHLETIYLKGNSSQIIEMVTQFKDSTGWKSQLNTEDATRQAKLDSMREVNSEHAIPNGDTVDKNDFDAAAKEAGL